MFGKITVKLKKIAFYRTIKKYRIYILVCLHIFFKGLGLISSYPLKELYMCFIKDFLSVFCMFICFNI